MYGPSSDAKFVQAISSLNTHRRPILKVVLDEVLCLSVNEIDNFALSSGLGIMCNENGCFALCCDNALLALYQNKISCQPLSGRDKEFTIFEYRTGRTDLESMTGIPWSSSILLNTYRLLPK